MDYRFYPASGITARGAGPSASSPEAWLAWHFTHVDNLARIAGEGGLLPPRQVEPDVNVALKGIKARRDQIAVQPDGNYPVSTVGDHVPFYLAPKSPMLYVVDRGHQEYSGGCAPLVFLGCLLGDVFASGATWCLSDGNAAAAYTRFSRNMAQLGSFVDFPLLCQRDWYNTDADKDRKRRRAAELLVHERVPLEMVTMVVAKTEPVLERARTALAAVGGMRQYHCKPEIYY